MDSTKGRRLWAIGLFFICSTLYFATRSPALDEWDSVQFALGVGDFNLWRHQPHPPGYPAYIAFGWLFSHVLPLPVPDALGLGSALGGGLFVACWFLLLARRFEAPLGLVTALSLATLLITWMTSTKVLTDGLEAGLLALTLLLLDADTDNSIRRRSAETTFAGQPECLGQDAQDGRRDVRPTRETAIAAGWRLGMAGLAAACAAGVRPQNIGIVLLILILGIRRARLPARGWGIGLGTLAGGCLLWLLPTAWLQARTPEAAGDPWAYLHQLLAQWRWRLDQPKAYVGATGQTSALLVYRLEHHPLGWLTRGFGFPLDQIWGWLAIALAVLGWTFYGLKLRAPDRGESTERDLSFWRGHLPWALAYVAMIFCFLPGDQRYYLPIFPLLLLPLVAGWWWALGRGRWLVWAIPLLTSAVTLPFAIQNHAEAAPPVRLLRWLQAAWPRAERPDVWLILRDSRRHADWYAPEFHLVRAEDFSGLPADGAWPAHARAVYTDDPLLAAQPAQRGGRWLLLKIFARSPLIYRKHNEADLYIFRAAKPGP